MSIDPGSLTIYDGIVYLYFDDEEKWIETDMKPEQLDENSFVVNICPIDTNVTVQHSGDQYTTIYPDDQNPDDQDPDKCLNVDTTHVGIETITEVDSDSPIAVTGISAGAYAYGDPAYVSGVPDDGNETKAKLNVDQDHDGFVSISVKNEEPESDVSATGISAVAEGSYAGEATTSVTTTSIDVSSDAKKMPLRQALQRKPSAGKKETLKYMYLSR